MFTTDEKVFALENVHISYVEFCAAWREKFETTPPNRNYGQRLRDKFAISGAVHHLPRSGRPRSARTIENMEFTAAAFAKDDHLPEINISPDRTTVVSVAYQLDISVQSVRNILRKDIGWCKKKARKVQMLTPFDIFRRAMFCRAMKRRFAVNPNFLDGMIWTDEAYFTLNGTVRTSSLTYWGDRKDRRKWYSKRRERHGVNVSVGLWRYGVIGPFFFDELPRIDLRRKQKGINAMKYVQLLRDYYIPEINRQFAMEDEDVRRAVWFQLDGATNHTAKVTKYYLNLYFPGRWMGHLGPVHFPPYSPDLTPLDSSFWSVLRNRVYQRRPATIPHLKQLIREECDAMTADYIERICVYDIKKRIDLVCQENGNYIEHIR